MFIRFVSNRNPKPHRKSENSINLFKLAGVGLVVFIIVSVITRAWRHADNADVFMEWLGDKVVSFYSELAFREYNIATYSDIAYKDNETIMTRFIDAINEHNNIYGYMEHKSAAELFCEKDPLYNYEDVAMKDSDSPDIKDETNNNIEDNSGSQQIADAGQVVQDDSKEENSDIPDNTTTENEQSSDYVVPAVSEAGVTYTMEQLSDFNFLMSKLYTVPSRALVYESDLVAEEMLKKDMTVQGDNSKPQILIYHTHSQEGFADSVAGDDSTNIVAVGAYLARILSEEYGYNVIHCQEHFDMASGRLDRSKAYTYAQYTIEQILEDNPTIEVILDLHRDGLPEGADKLVTNINGKETAKIMFFNGVSRSSATGDIDYLYNRYRSDNLAFSFQLKLMAMECYPEFTRRNYIDAYQYNLHHRQKSVLVEAGAQNNTLQEELNAMEVLAEVLHRVISPEEK